MVFFLEMQVNVRFLYKYFVDGQFSLFLGSEIAVVSHDVASLGCC
jgi:hypothetical protein